MDPEVGNCSTPLVAMHITGLPNHTHTKECEGPRVVGHINSEEESASVNADDPRTLRNMQKVIKVEGDVKDGGQDKAEDATDERERKEEQENTRENPITATCQGPMVPVRRRLMLWLHLSQPWRAVAIGKCQ
ncbi:hypothetical protein NDU88_002792 [Pleurodeles waltl]|uniref:Uncharacterized protein n=1 Tax=Pleurodeles waltl TaxID=8319 RepID=A0AAV7T4A0_PLEWA|nr:hypothetical protein NDU88_002792 [Pleurodeles waltl]